MSRSFVCTVSSHMKQRQQDHGSCSWRVSPTAVFVLIQRLVQHALPPHRTPPPRRAHVDGRRAGRRPSHRRSQGERRSQVRAKIANTSAVGRPAGLGTRHPPGGTAGSPPWAPEAPSLPPSTGTSSPSLRQGRGPLASPPPRHSGHVRPAATPSGPGRRSSSRHPTADRPRRPAARLPDRTLAVSLDQSGRGTPGHPHRGAPDAPSPTCSGEVVNPSGPPPHRCPVTIFRSEQVKSLHVNTYMLKRFFSLRCALKQS